MGSGRFPRHTKCQTAKCARCGTIIKKKLGRRDENYCINCAIWKSIFRVRRKKLK